MSISVTRTRIIIPRRRPELIARPRLLAQLDEMVDNKLVILSAPAGYGKTSLLVDFATRAEYAVCWYALDSLDADIFQFSAHLLVALTEQFPSFGQQSRGLFENSASKQNLNRLVTRIVNEVHETIHAHFVLILDDYHLVDSNLDINYFLNQLIQNASENFHFIIATRALVSLPDLTRWVARGQVGALGMAEFAFRADEIQALVQQNYQEALSEAAARQLEHETEGWITGLVLSAQLGPQAVEARQRLGHIAGVGLYEYLANQVFDQQSPAIRDFLLRTALLEEFNAELCQAVFDSSADAHGSSWEQLIQTVLRHNLFTLPVDEAGTWLRYHHLFRDFLQMRLGREHPQERERILRRLGAVYAERREWDKAYQVYARLGDVESSADVIERSGSAMIKNGRYQTLRVWLETLPRGVWSNRASLVSLRGAIETAIGDVKQGLELFNTAATAFQSAGDEFGLARTLVRRGMNYLQQGKYAEATADAAQVLALGEGQSALREIRAEALRIKGLGLNRIGQWKEASELLEQANDLYAALELPQNVAMVQLELGMVYRALGSFDRAKSSYNQALAYWRGADDPIHLANTLNSLGVLYHFQEEYAQAVDYLEEALDTARQSEYALVEGYALASLGDVYVDLDMASAAHEVYDQARQVAQRIHNQFLLLYVEIAQAALARRQGEYLQAHQWLARAENIAGKTNSLYEKEMYLLESGRFAMAEGHADQAIDYFENAVLLLKDSNQRDEGARAHLCLAAAFHSVQNTEMAASHFERAFQLAAELPNQHSLVTTIREMPTLVRTMQNDSVVGSLATRLLEQVEKFEQEIPLWRRALRHHTKHALVVPSHLSLQGFGRFQATRDGKIVTGSDWQTQVTRDLFFCFLAHPNGLTKESIGELLWLESTPAQLKLRFKNTLYRLRHALGDDVILYENEVYRFNRALDYEYDVENFEWHIAQAQRAMDSTERAAAYRAALALYAGPYFAEMDGTWVWHERERLWQLYVHAALELGEAYLTARTFNKVLELVNQLLTHDRSVEPAYRLAMRAHAGLGNRSAVTRQFEQCRQVLMDDLRISPTRETIELYEQLVR